MKVQIYNIIKRTAGGFHSWCESNVGRIRKPNNVVDMLVRKIDECFAEEFLKPKWYQRFWYWIKNLFNKK